MVWLKIPVVVAMITGGDVPTSCEKQADGNAQWLKISPAAPDVKGG